MHTYGLTITIEQWNTDPTGWSARARAEARRERAKAWEVCVEIDGLLITKASGKV